MLAHIKLNALLTLSKSRTWFSPPSSEKALSSNSQSNLRVVALRVLLCFVFSMSFLSEGSLFVSLIPIHLFLPGILEGVLQMALLLRLGVRRILGA